MSVTCQYIIIFIVLFLIIAWIIYKLTRKEKKDSCNCGHCTVSNECKAKSVREAYERRNGECHLKK